MRKRLRTGLKTVAVMAAATMAITGCGGKQEVNGLNEAKVVENQQKFTEQDGTETTESKVEDIVAEDQVANATYNDPAQLGEWVEVKCGVIDDEEYTHKSDSHGKAYLRITDVLNSENSKEYYREHIQGWESSWTDDMIGLNKVDMDEDGKTQWNVVKYDIYFPSDFSECGTCYPDLDNTVLFYYAVGDDNIDLVDNEDTKQTWAYGELHSLSMEMCGTKADREYDENWQETHKIDEEYYKSGVRDRGTLSSGWIMFWTHMEPDQTFKIDVRPLSERYTGSGSNDYYNPHESRSVHDGSDTGKYITIHITDD